MKKTINSVMATIKDRVEQSLSLASVEAGISFPAKRYTLIAYKMEQMLQLWGRNDENDNVFIKEYALTANSGIAGPKLQEGDLQIPEGVYDIEALNPESKFYLSLKVNYPNAFDLQMAKTDGRSDLGGDIFLHGGSKSTGCIAIGDIAIEELFYIGATTGFEKFIISPCYFEGDRPVVEYKIKIHWYETLLKEINFQLHKYRVKNKPR